MIIYGSRNKQLAKEIINEKCNHFGKQNCIDMYVFQKYAHVFWIPFFSIGKTGVSQCDHCKQMLKLKEMPSDYRLAYDNLKAQTKIPIWMFSGVALIVFGIIFGTISEKIKIKKMRN
jgi:hypothetical protein